MNETAALIARPKLAIDEERVRAAVDKAESYRPHLNAKHMHCSKLMREKRDGGALPENAMQDNASIVRTHGASFRLLSIADRDADERDAELENRRRRLMNDDRLERERARLHLLESRKRDLDSMLSKANTLSDLRFTEEDVQALANEVVDSMGA